MASVVVPQYIPKRLRLPGYYTPCLPISSVRASSSSLSFIRRCARLVGLACLLRPGRTGGHRGSREYYTIQHDTRIAPTGSHDLRRPAVPREARRRRPHAALIRSSDIAPRGLVDAFDGGQRVRPPPPSSATALPDHAPTGNWPVNLPRAAATRPLHRRRDAAPPRATSTTSFGMCQTAMGMMIKCTRTHVKTDPATLRRAARALFCVKNENFCSTFWWLIATFAIHRRHCPRVCGARWPHTPNPRT